MSIAELTGPKQKRGELRRAALIETATVVFLERGYGGASLDDIVAAAGGSRRNIYEWFGNKEGLFGAVVGEACKEIIAKLSEVQDGDEDPAETLTKFGRVFLDILLAPDTLALYRVVIAESARFPELGRAFFEAAPALGYAGLSAQLEKWAATGRIILDDPDLAARLFLEMVKSDLHIRALIDPANPPDPTEVERHLRAAVSLLMDGIRPERRAETVQPRRMGRGSTAGDSVSQAPPATRQRKPRPDTAKPAKAKEGSAPTSRARRGR